MSDPKKSSDRITFVIRLTLQGTPSEPTEIMGQFKCIESGQTAPVNGFPTLEKLILTSMAQMRSAQ